MPLNWFITIGDKSNFFVKLQIWWDCVGGWWYQQESWNGRPSRFNFYLFPAHFVPWWNSFAQCHLSCGEIREGCGAPARCGVLSVWPQFVRQRRRAARHSSVHLPHCYHYHNGATLLQTENTIIDSCQIIRFRWSPQFTDSPLPTQYSVSEEATRACFHNLYLFQYWLPWQYPHCDHHHTKHQHGRRLCESVLATVHSC